MSYLLLFSILAMTGALSGYMTGRLVQPCSMGTPMNMVFGSLGAMACLHLLSGTGIAGDGLAIGSISLQVGCGIVGGVVLALAAGIVHKTTWDRSPGQ